MRFNKLAAMMRIAGDESRLKILCALWSEERLCVSEMADRLGMSVATASHHLRVMSEEGLIEPMREGKRVCYIMPREPFMEDLKKLVCKYK